MRCFLLSTALALLLGAARPLYRPATSGPTRTMLAASGTVLSNAARTALPSSVKYSRASNIGARDAHINPRYARVGWNTYWQNDEWWVEKQIA